MDLITLFIQILIAWGLTISISFAIEFVQESKIFKYLADQGYKLNFDLFSEFQQDIGQKKSMMPWILIPFYNIFKVLENTINCSIARGMILEPLSSLNIIEKLSEWEIKEYEKNPTVLNATILPIKYQRKLNESIKVKFDDGSKIYYVRQNNNISAENISILKVEGPAIELNIAEQKDLIVKYYSKEKQSINLAVDNMMKSDVNNGSNVIFNIENILKENDRLSLISLQKKELQNLKKDLINDAVKISSPKKYQKINKK